MGADDLVTRAHGAGSSGTSTPAGAHHGLDADIGTTLGRYVVVERVGSGGMGTVVRAYDPRLHREVALKRVHRGAVGTDAAARTMREAQAMAQLSHPNVVAVYDVEVIDDTIVIAMEYVAGPTIDVWRCARPRAWREIVAVFASAATGLLAAHRAGLVHRDFKPSNVLVAEDGRAKVTDFGLAKPIGGAPASEASMLAFMASGDPRGADLERTLTRADTVVGTPKYMAPEQHVGEPADARADQYAVCLSLWEALSGRPVFVADSWDALAVAKLRGPPAWSRVEGVPQRLGEALRRGLAPTPAARWPDLAELLAILNEAVRPRRRASTAVVAVLTTAAAAAAFVAWRRASPCDGAEQRLAGTWDASRKDAVAATLLGSGSQLAATTHLRVDAMLDDYAEQWRAGYRDACEATAIRGEQSDAALDLRMACLERRKLELGAGIDLLASDATVVGTAIEVASNFAPVDGCADVVALQAEIPPPDNPELAAAVEASRVELARATTLHAAGRYQAALELAEAVGRTAGAADYLPLRLEVELAVASAQARLAHFDEAERGMQQVLDHAIEHGLDELAARSAGALTQLVGVSLSRTGEGEVYAELALALARHRRIGGVLEARARNGLGAVLGTAARHTDCEVELRRALEILTAIEGEEIEVGRTYQSLGVALWSQGHFVEAEREHRLALALRERVLGPDHVETSASHEQLGIVLASQGRYTEAEAEQRHALASREAALGPDHPETALSRASLGRALRDRGRFVEAERLHREAVSSLERSLGAAHPTTASRRGELGIDLMHLDRPAEAQQAFELAQLALTAALGDDHPITVSATVNLGKALAAQGRLVDAEREYRRALPALLSSLAVDHRDVAVTRILLADALEGQQRYPEAEAELRRAVTSMSNTLGADHIDVGAARNNLAGVLESQRKWDEAELEYRAALRIIAPLMPPQSPNFAIAHFDLGELLLRRGKIAEALPLLERARESISATEAGPAIRAELAFGLALGLAGAGEQAPRALALARHASELYASAEGEHAAELREIEIWLAERGAPR